MSIETYQTNYNGPNIAASVGRATELYVPYDCKLKELVVRTGPTSTAPAAGNVVFNIKKNGVNLFSDDTETTLTGGVFEKTADSLSIDLLKGDRITLGVVSVVGGYLAALIGFQCSFENETSFMLPPGGTTGQVPAKASGADGDYEYVDPDSGPPGSAGADGSGYKGTSATSYTIATGSKTFTTQSGLAYSIGARVRLSSNADPTNFVEGLCTAYSGTSLTVNITLIGGTGAHTDWNINLAGEPAGGGGTVNATQIQGRNVEFVAITAGYADNFPGSSLNGGYNSSHSGTNGTTTVSSNKAHVVSFSGTSYYSVYWGTDYEFKDGAWLMAKIENVTGPVSLGSIIKFGVLANSEVDSSNANNFEAMFYGDQLLLWRKAGGSADFGGTTYDATNHKYVRLRRSGGNIILEGSPNGTSSWVTIATKSFAYTEGTTFHPFFESGNGAASFDISEITSSLGNDINYPDKSVLMYNRGDAQFEGKTLNSLAHYQSEDSVVPTQVAGAGAGSSGLIVTMEGNDIAHSFTIQVGSSPSGSEAIISTVTLHSSFGLKPRVIFSPANGAAAGLSGATAIYMDSTSPNTYVIKSGATALSNGSIYKWNIHLLN